MVVNCDRKALKTSWQTCLLFKNMQLRTIYQGGDIISLQTGLPDLILIPATKRRVFRCYLLMISTLILMVSSLHRAKTLLPAMYKTGTAMRSASSLIKKRQFNLVLNPAIILWGKK